jgi:hypothetical protein
VLALIGEATMGHFGHLAHEHAVGVWIAIAVAMFVACGMGAWAAISGSRKDSDD